MDCLEHARRPEAPPTAVICHPENGKGAEAAERVPLCGPELPPAAAVASGEAETYQVCVRAEWKKQELVTSLAPAHHNHQKDPSWQL